MHANAGAVVLLAITGLFAALILAALITGRALSLNLQAVKFRFVRMSQEPRLFWTILGAHGVVLVFLIWLDVASLPGQAT